MELPNNVRKQIKEAFWAMSRELGLPVPSDADAEKFAEEWWTEEERQTFEVGCADFETRKATIFAIEAARNMCGGRFGDEAAIKLLKLALAEMEETVRKRFGVRP